MPRDGRPPLLTAEVQEKIITTIKVGTYRQDAAIHAGTRAEKSLALVAYTADPNRLASTVESRGWFASDEIILL